MVDAVSPLDLVSFGTLVHFTALYGQLRRGRDAHVSGKSGLFSRRSVSQRPEPEPVGGCHEHLHAGV